MEENESAAKQKCSAANLFGRIFPGVRFSTQTTHNLQLPSTQPWYPFRIPSRKDPDHMEINIQNVSMTYPSGNQALQNLSLELRSPSLIGLLGLRKSRFRSFSACFPLG